MTYQHNNKDPNLNNLHHAMEIVDDLPHLRVTLGSDTITITGNVNVGTEVKINNTEADAIPVYFPENPTVNQGTGGTSAWKVDIGNNGQVTLKAGSETIGKVDVNNWPATQAVTGTFWQTTQPVSIATMPTTPVTGTFWQTTQPVSGTVTIQDGGNTITVDGTVNANVTFPSIYKISKDTNDNSTSNRIFVDVGTPTISGTVELGATTLSALENINATVSGTVALDSASLSALENINATVSGTVELGTTTLSALENTTVTISGTPTVNIGTIPEVEIKNDTGNPVPISATTAANTALNPIYVSTSGGSSSMQITGYPDSAVTAFEEPLAVGITPLIQATSIYGLDPDFWVTTKLNGGAVSTTTSSTWQVSSGTTAGGYARLATAKYMTYQPGQGSMFRWTAAFTTTDAASTNPYPTKNSLGIDNIVQNTGPIDRTDGYSFGYSGSTADNASRKIGILHRRGGGAETQQLTITRAPTGAQTAVVTLNGIQYNIAITASTSVAYTAEQLAKGLNAIAEANNMWDIEACGGIITFTYYSPGAKTGTYSFSASGTGTLALGTFSQIVAGVTPIDTWTYVADWDNQSIQFDPTKLNVFGVDLRWLGAGRVRFFMEDPSTGKIVLVHTQRWTSQYLVPHIYKPSLRLIYRSGTTNPAITPSQNVVVTGASVFAGIQGMVNQTGGSQAYYNIDSTTRAKDTVWHLMSMQNPYVRNNAINKASMNLQDLTVAVQANDPSVLYIVKNAIGTSDLLVYNPIPNTTVSMFAQYSISAVTENLALDRVTNIQTVGINGSAQFDLMKYNLTLSPGETVSVFINSSNAISRTSVGITWHVD